MQEVLNFWFEEVDPKQWWSVDPLFDEQISKRFGDLLISASKGELYEWRATAEGCLAEIIVLDQFSRNIHRNTPSAFTQDAMALVLAQEAVRRNLLAELSSVDARGFLLIPYMHSESQCIHREAEVLYKAWASEVNYEFELKHKAIIDQFGRYPHRNKILNRPSTQEEEAFLLLPGSAF